MCVDMGGFHTFGERGVHRGFMKGGFTWGSRKGGFTGGFTKRGVHVNPMNPLATGLYIRTYVRPCVRTYVRTCVKQKFRASKLYDHTIGRSPYLQETQSGDFYANFSRRNNSRQQLLSCICFGGLSDIARGKNDKINHDGASRENSLFRWFG